MGNQLGSILENQMVYKIDVVDDTGASQFAGVAKGREAPRYPFEHSQDIKYDDGGGAKVIGKISFVMSEDKVVDGVLSRFISVLLLNGLKAIIVSALLFLVLKRLITRPIEDLVRHFRKAEAPKSKDVTIEIHDRNTSYDEMSELLEFITIRERALGEFNEKNISTIQAQADTIEHTNEQMALERERAELSARMAQLGEMSAGIAHEINNPLTIINGYVMRARLELKKNPGELTKLEEVLGSIEKTTLRISKIVSGLRAYARDGRHDPFTPVTASSIVTDAVEMCRGRLKGGDVELRVLQTWSDDQKIDCRAAQLVQVLVVMINNAFDAVKTFESRWVEVGGDVDGDKLIFTVTDSGSGIPLEIEKKIFDPFFTTKPPGEGTGLGLSVTFSIIKSHNGEVYLNRGCANTQFVVRLPIRQMSQMSEKASA
jgi:C4-dicarboxylate-specific signal transduction histidine kinase